MCIVLFFSSSSSYFFFLFFFALDNTDQCIHLGTRPAHHQLAFASGRAPVSFPVPMVDLNEHNAKYENESEPLLAP